MKILFYGFYLFFLGVSADGCKTLLNTRLERCAAHDKGLSSPLNIRLSNIAYRLYRKFSAFEIKFEKELRFANSPRFAFIHR